MTGLSATVPAGRGFAHPSGRAGLDTAAEHARAGRVEETISAYRREVDRLPGPAGAHLGLGNELLRSVVAARVVEAHGAVEVRGVALAPSGRR